MATLVTLAGLAMVTGYLAVRHVFRSLSRPLTSDERDRAVIFLNCLSDGMTYYERPLKDHAAENLGQLPNQEQLKIRLRRDWGEEDYEGFTRCWGTNGGHFILHPRLSQLNTNMDGTVPLVWCPPGNHGRWIGAIVLKDHGIHPLEIIETNELERLLRDQLPLGQATKKK
jgi:hypothetical protein